MSTLWKELTRIEDFKTVIRQLTLGQRKELHRITKKELIAIFPTLCECGVTIESVERLHNRSNRFIIVLQKIGLCYRSRSDASFYLAQMPTVKTDA